MIAKAARSSVRASDHGAPRTPGVGANAGAPPRPARGERSRRRPFAAIAACTTRCSSDHVGRQRGGAACVAAQPIRDDFRTARCRAAHDREARRARREQRIEGYRHGAALPHRLQESRHLGLVTFLDTEKGFADPRFSALPKLRAAEIDEPRYPSFAEDLESFFGMTP